MEQTKLQKAMERQGKRKRYSYPKVENYTYEDFELVQAWLKGEVGIKSVCVAIGKTDNQSPSGYTYIAMVLREMIVNEEKTKEIIRRNKQLKKAIKLSKSKK